MAKHKSSKYQWVYSPKAAPKPKVPDEVKLEVSQLAQALIDEWKPKYIQTPPIDGKYNFFGYLTEIFTKWHRSFFYFVYKLEYRVPNADSKYREQPFTRLEYAGPGKFNLAYMRHTGSWWEVEQERSLASIFTLIRENNLYHPPSNNPDLDTDMEEILEALRREMESELLDIPPENE
ncbi:hypothetical protein RIF25_16535 [Thermosynechococcaceae cyanobacterium BACA0444]|uniref:Uncharacterized protein n=1 Tax=Pseudocalidococcus azoricus BACA0444 TaxID=2918990 RepID=A0AAE4FWT0_9CYAN|nr:hypothetical protein [Pseudocalidococcus azoricus]MDS3862405.1 hypothetical protein [Pseudocalidococcus azoricus BACA0444]